MLLYWLIPSASTRKISHQQGFISGINSSPEDFIRGGIPLTSFMIPLTAMSLLVFTLLYTPCVAAISTVKREMSGKWAIGVALGQFVIAWIAAFLVRLTGLLLGLM